MASYKVTLFITAEKAANAAEQLNRLVYPAMWKSIQIETVDVEKEPDKARPWKIVNTPALVVQREGEGGGMPERVFHSLEDAYSIQYALGRKIW